MDRRVPLLASRRTASSREVQTTSRRTTAVASLVALAVLRCLHAAIFGDATSAAGAGEGGALVRVVAMFVTMFRPPGGDDVAGWRLRHGRVPGRGRDEGDEGDGGYHADAQSYAVARAALVPLPNPLANFRRRCGGEKLRDVGEDVVVVKEDAAFSDAKETDEDEEERRRRYLIAACTHYQFSNRYYCIRRAAETALLTNRTLVFPVLPAMDAVAGAFLDPGQLKARWSAGRYKDTFYDPSGLFDLDHYRQCAGEDAVVTWGEFRRRWPCRLAVAMMTCVSRRTAATKMDRTCKAKCKCKGVDAYAPLGVRFEATRDGFIPRRRRTVYSVEGYLRALRGRTDAKVLAVSELFGSWIADAAPPGGGPPGEGWSHVSRHDAGVPHGPCPGGLLLPAPAVFAAADAFASAALQGWGVGVGRLGKTFGTGGTSINLGRASVDPGGRGGDPTVGAAGGKRRRLAGSLLSGGRGRGYLAVHLRLGDLKEGVLDVERARTCVAAAAAAAGSASVFLATDADAAQMDRLRVNLPGGSSVVFLSDAGGAVWDTLVAGQAGAVRDVEVAGERRLSARDQQARAMLEKTLAARAGVFLGTPHSTFTAHIARLRRQLGTASDLDGFLCGGGGGGGGVGSGLAFAHPGKWGVVWSNATSLLGDRRDDHAPLPAPLPNKTPATPDFAALDDADGDGVGGGSGSVEEEAATDDMVTMAVTDGGLMEKLGARIRHKAAEWASEGSGGVDLVTSPKGTSSLSSGRHGASDSGASAHGGHLERGGEGPGGHGGGGHHASGRSVGIGSAHDHPVGRTGSGTRRDGRGGITGGRHAVVGSRGGAGGGGGGGGGVTRGSAGPHAAGTRAGGDRDLDGRTVAAGGAHHGPHHAVHHTPRRRRRA